MNMPSAKTKFDINCYILITMPYVGYIASHCHYLNTITFMNNYFIEFSDNLED